MSVTIAPVVRDANNLFLEAEFADFLDFRLFISQIASSGHNQKLINPPTNWTRTMRRTIKIIPVLLLASLAPFARSGSHATLPAGFSLWHHATVSAVSEPSTKSTAFQLPCQ